MAGYDWRTSLSILSFILVALLSPVSCGGQQPVYLQSADTLYLRFFDRTVRGLLPQYRLPEEADFKDYWTYYDSFVYRTEDDEANYKAPFWTKGRFNADDVIDFAYILVDKETGKKSLFAIVSELSRYQALVLEEDFDDEMGLATQGRGEVVTGAGRGFWPEEDEPAVLTLDRDAIAFFHFEGRSSLFVWDSTSHQFRQYWISD